MAHGQWTEIEARGDLKAWRKSGQSLERHGVAGWFRSDWWKQKLGSGAVGDRARTPAPLPVQVTQSGGEGRRGEPVTVLLRSGHMLNVGRDFDESAFARVLGLLERAWYSDCRRASASTSPRRLSTCATAVRARSTIPAAFGRAFAKIDLGTHRSHESEQDARCRTRPCLSSLS